MHRLASVLTMPPISGTDEATPAERAWLAWGSRMASKANLRRLMFAARQWFGFCARNSKLHARKLPGLTQTLVGTTRPFTSNEVARSSSMHVHSGGLRLPWERVFRVVDSDHQLRGTPSPPQSVHMTFGESEITAQQAALQLPRARSDECTELHRANSGVSEGQDVKTSSPRFP